MDAVLIFFAGVAIGAVVEYIYDKNRNWQLDEIVEIIDMIRHNEHVKRHLKAMNNGTINKIVDVIEKEEL